MTIAKGRVKFFNDSKNYGFVTRDDGGGDVFFHRSELPLGIEVVAPGVALSFEIDSTSRGQRAINIAMMK